MPFLGLQYKGHSFILPDLSSFDGIVAFDLLKQAGVCLCLHPGHLKWGTELEKIAFHGCPEAAVATIRTVNDYLRKNLPLS